MSRIDSCICYSDKFFCFILIGIGSGKKENIWYKWCLAHHHTSIGDGWWRKHSKKNRLKYLQIMKCKCRKKKEKKLVFGSKTEKRNLKAIVDRQIHEQNGNDPSHTVLHNHKRMNYKFFFCSVGGGFGVAESSSSFDFRIINTAKRKKIIHFPSSWFSLCYVSSHIYLGTNTESVFFSKNCHTQLKDLLRYIRIDFPEWMGWYLMPLENHLIPFYRLFLLFIYFFFAWRDIKSMIDLVSICDLLMCWSCDWFTIPVYGRRFYDSFGGHKCLYFLLDPNQFDINQGTNGLKI